MAGYSSSGRKQALNVSQYVANLNTIPDGSAQPQDNDFDIDDELAQFTNTDFIDFDAGNLFEAESQQGLDYDAAAADEKARRENAGNNAKGLDFVHGMPILIPITILLICNGSNSQQTSLSSAAKDYPSRTNRH